jgi:beta-glucosidase
MSKQHLPEGFLFGTATSAHQVEGGNANSWTEWEKAQGHHVLDGSASGTAADHWNRYGSDFHYLSEMNLNAHRFSVEWSRLEPRKGEWDQAAMDRYKDMVRELNALGIAPMVTLHHFTNPIWIEKQGGWTNPDTVNRFVTFATRVVEQLGPEVGYWCTINEPTVEIGLGYMVGTFPPGEKNLWHFLRARRLTLAAHRRVYTAIHELYRRHSWSRPQVSFAHHLSWVEPDNPHNPLDRLSTGIYNLINNRYFLRRTLKTVDFIGVNYYFFRRLKFTLGGALVIAREMPLPDAPKSDLGWPILPEGLYRLCREVAKLGKPLIITENGLADAKDTLRPWSLAAHIQALQLAIAEGADIRGYFHWSLLDTFEWENGYRPKYGLIEVNFANQKRTPRASAKVYADIAHTRAVGKIPARPLS